MTKHLEQNPQRHYEHLLKVNAALQAQNGNTHGRTLHASNQDERTLLPQSRGYDINSSMHSSPAEYNQTVWPGEEEGRLEVERGIERSQRPVDPDIIFGRNIPPLFPQHPAPSAPLFPAGLHRTSHSAPVQQPMSWNALSYSTMESSDPHYPPAGAYHAQQLDPQLTPYLYEANPQTQAPSFDATEHPAPPSYGTTTPPSVDEDRRQRNTAASARFRVKKKQQEEARLAAVNEKRDHLTKLKDRITELKAENKWLKQLLLEKKERNHPPTAADEDEATEQDDEGQ